MKWVALVILVCIGTYTFVTLHYRKPGKAYEPYQDAKERATVQRLESAGYQRITANAEIPADPRKTLALVMGTPADIREATGGLPAELVETLIDKPTLPQAFASVTAAKNANPLLPYAVQFTCTLPDHKHLLASTHVYVKETEVAIVCHFDSLDGELLARSRETVVFLTLPAGSLQPGSYNVTLVGSRQSRQWPLQVH